MEADIKADVSFFQSCHDILKETDCLPDPDHPDKVVSMSDTMMCVTNAMAESSKESEFY